MDKTAKIDVLKECRAIISGHEIECNQRQTALEKDFEENDGCPTRLSFEREKQPGCFPLLPGCFTL